MRPGYNQFDLIDQLKNFESMKHDYLVNTENIGFDTFTRHEHSNNGKETVNYYPEMFLHGSANASFEINNTMQTQMANKLGVPKTYWDKCLQEAPHLLKDNVIHWLKDKPKTMMVRTLGMTGRAYLSDRYARYDHFDVLEKVMPIMTKFDMEFRDSYITDDKLYLRATFPNIERDIVHDGKKVTS